MIQLSLKSAGMAVAAGLVLCAGAGSAVAQESPKPAAKPAAKSAANGKFTPPKTSWGEPDLRGIWPLNHLIATPLQRPEKYGDRRMMTEDEFAAAKKAADARNKRFESGPIPQADSGTEVMQITSMISEPANGRFPALTPHGKELYAAMHGSYKPGQTVFDSPRTSTAGTGASRAECPFRCCPVITTTVSGLCRRLATSSFSSRWPMRSALFRRLDARRWIRQLNRG